MELYGDSAKALARRIFTFQKRAARYTAELKQWESCRDSFRQLKILAVYSLCIQETTLYAKEKGAYTLNKQIHTQNTRNNNDHRTMNKNELMNGIHMVCMVSL
jgi:hypothetical protein